jgi:hypothetical protein
MSLTPSQWRLYEFLKANTDRWVTQFEIHQALKECYPSYESTENFHDTIARQYITSDIQKINESDIIQKIILSSSVGVKIATEEEYKVWSQNKWKSIKQMIRRLAWKDYKAKMDGQMKLVFGDKMARDYYESFVKEYQDFLEDKTNETK